MLNLDLLKQFMGSMDGLEVNMKVKGKESEIVIKGDIPQILEKFMKIQLVMQHNSDLEYKIDKIKDEQIK